MGNGEILVKKYRLSVIDRFGGSNIQRVTIVTNNILRTQLVTKIILKRSHHKKGIYER